MVLDTTLEKKPPKTHQNRDKTWMEGKKYTSQGQKSQPDLQGETTPVANRPKKWEMSELLLKNPETKRLHGTYGVYAIPRVFGKRSPSLPTFFTLFPVSLIVDIHPAGSHQSRCLEIDRDWNGDVFATGLSVPLLKFTLGRFGESFARFFPSGFKGFCSINTRVF